MKTVFSSHSEVAHVWASQSQQHGTAGNISFNGASILSYHWWEMATLYTDKTGKQYCFIRNWSYSNSTSKHLLHVRRAVPDYYEMFPVHGGNSGYYNYSGSHGTLLDHESNILYWIH